MPNYKGRLVPLNLLRNFVVGVLALTVGSMPGYGATAGSLCDLNELNPWYEELLQKSIDKFIGEIKVRDRAVSLALRNLRDHGVPLPGDVSNLQSAPTKGIKPSRMLKVLQNLDNILIGVEALEALADGDGEKATDIVRKAALKSGMVAGLEIIGVPLVGAMFLALEVTILSFEKRQRQDRLLDVDYGFYVFLNDKELQSLLEHDRKKAVRYYVDKYLIPIRRHRRVFQSYMDSELPENQRIKVHSEYPDDFLWKFFLTVDKIVENEKLFSLVMTMLLDFEQKRERQLPTGQSTRHREEAKRLRASAGFKTLHSAAKILGSNGIWIREQICALYREHENKQLAAMAKTGRPSQRTEEEDDPFYRTFRAWRENRGIRMPEQKPPSKPPCDNWMKGNWRYLSENITQPLFYYKDDFTLNSDCTVKARQDKSSSRKNRWEIKGNKLIVTWGVGRDDAWVNEFIVPGSKKDKLDGQTIPPDEYRRKNRLSKNFRSCLRRDLSAAEC